jgi:FAD/FMN-containing dehydrogenase
MAERLQFPLASSPGRWDPARRREAGESMAQGTEIDGGAVDELQASFRGELVRPDDAGYDEHRKVWNGSIDRHPGLIARCTGVEDVRAAIRLARSQDLLVAVRGGGHSFPGLSVCDGGMLIDLGPMKGIRMDPEARTVRVQGGVLLGELDRETQELGLSRRESSPIPEWLASRWAAASVGSCASTGSRSISCCPWT